MSCCGWPHRRVLPERPGKCSVVHQRYAYWYGKGHFDRLFQAVQQPMRRTQALKIHAMCDALGKLLGLVLTPGHRHDSKRAVGLLGGLQAKALLAGKAYDSHKIVQAPQKRGMQVIIPSKLNRKNSAS
jgi:transposase